MVETCSKRGTRRQGMHASFSGKQARVMSTVSFQYIKLDMHYIRRSTVSTPMMALHLLVLVNRPFSKLTMLRYIGFTVDVYLHISWMSATNYHCALTHHWMMSRCSKYRSGPYLARTRCHACYSPKVPSLGPLGAFAVSLR